MPIPPATFATGFTLAQIRGGQGAFVFDPAQDGVELFFVTRAEPFGPVRPEADFVRGEAVVPVAVQLHRQDRGVVGPVFPQGAVFLYQVVQRVGLVGLAARPQDHVVGAFDRVDAVNLDKADAVDQGRQGRAGGRTRWRFGQGVAVKEQAAGQRVQDQHGGTLTGAGAGAKRQIALVRLGRDGVKVPRGSEENRPT